MMVQAAVIQIDGSHHSFSVVADKNLGMNKTRRVFIDSDTGFQQGFIMGLCQCIGNLLVRNPRQNHCHIHPPLRSIFQSSLHLPIQNQIGCHDVHIPKRPVEDIHVNPLSQLVIIQRPVPVRHNIASRLLCSVALRNRCRKYELFRKFQCFFIDIPHLQEHQRKALHRLSLQHNGRILPMSETLNPVDIFIRQIDASVEGSVSVDHQNLAVVPVIIMGGNKGRHRGKNLAFDPQFPQQLQIFMGKKHKLTGAVIHQTYIHALLCLAGQNFQHLPPHQSFVNDKIFQKNEMLRLLQLPQHFGKLVLSQRKIGHLCPVIYRMASAPLNIPHQRCRTGVLFLQSLPDRFRLRNGILCHPDDLAEAGLQSPMPDIHLGIQIQQCPEHRRQHDNHQPCNLRGGIDAAVEQVQHHCNRKQQHSCINVRTQLLEPVIDPHQKSALQ